MGKIIFIDDEEMVRDTYKVAMELLFGQHFDVLALDVEKSLRDMMNVLDEIDDKVIYFIDEKLKHTGKAKYTGLELIEQIRVADSKIPIYILTSAADDIDKYNGNIEFVIDKNDWAFDENSDFSQRFIRHINTYRDIKSAMAKRFDELFEKSLFSELSQDEAIELSALNLNRSRRLIDEPIIDVSSLESIRAASEELKAIYDELVGDKK